MYDKLKKEDVELFRKSSVLCTHLHHLRSNCPGLLLLTVYIARTAYTAIVNVLSVHPMFFIFPILIFPTSIMILSSYIRHAKFVHEKM